MTLIFFKNSNNNIGFFEVPKIPKIIRYFGGNSGIKEIFGCHHMKYNVFDNDIIITGFLVIK